MHARMHESCVSILRETGTRHTCRRQFETDWRFASGMHPEWDNPALLRRRQRLTRRSAPFAARIAPINFSPRRGHIAFNLTA
jgi:hypothetical protein